MNENTTLFVLLRLLRESGTSESVLIQKYNLSRQALWRIRKGNNLPIAHDYYFRCFMEEVDLLRMESLKNADVHRYRDLTELMFQVMATELKLDFLLK